MAIGIITLVFLFITNVLMMLYASTLLSELRKTADKINKNTDDDFAEALSRIYNMDKVKDVAQDVDEVVVE